MNGMCDIEYFALSGLGLFGPIIPGRCPGLDYLAPLGQNARALHWAGLLGLVGGCYEIRFAEVEIRW